MDTKSGVAEIDGGRLYYEEAGQGRPLVFLHGFTFSTALWDDQFTHFAADHGVLRYDLRGFGRSTVPVEGSPYSHVNDLRMLLDHLGIGRAVICGFSMGGGVAVDFALTHPEMVEALVLVDSTLGGYRWTEEESNIQRAVFRRAREQGIEAARELWLRDPLFTRAMGKPNAAARLMKMVEDYSGWHWLHRDPQVSPKPPALERLAEIAVPTLVVVGELDIPDMQGMAETLARGIPGARSAVIPGAGHVSNLEAPTDFNAVARRFTTAEA